MTDRSPALRENDRVVQSLHQDPAPLVEPTEGYMRKKTQNGGREMKQERWKGGGKRQGTWPRSQAHCISNPSEKACGHLSRGVHYLP